MKQIVISVLAAAALAAATPAFASRQLAAERGCLECHAVDKEVWGPSFRQVAKYYRPLSDGRDRIAKRILAGGAEHWGPDRSMPAQATKTYLMDEADAKRLADWILKQR
ncbi:MAG: c-type cytochrome [Burkholderiales bacterium]|nr:c-type cytochrome [Burkholderiales bacterium]